VEDSEAVEDSDAISCMLLQVHDIYHSIYHSIYHGIYHNIYDDMYNCIYHDIYASICLIDLYCYIRGKVT
jgi:hypothetical protein